MSDDEKNTEDLIWATIVMAIATFCAPGLTTVSLVKLFLMPSLHAGQVWTFGILLTCIALTILSALMGFKEGLVAHLMVCGSMAVTMLIAAFGFNAAWPGTLVSCLGLF